MILAELQLVLFVLPSMNRSTCSGLLLTHIINIPVSLIDYLLECVYSRHACIMFTEWNWSQDICHREHYDVFLIFNNGVIWITIILIECILYMCNTKINLQSILWCIQQSNYLYVSLMLYIWNYEINFARLFNINIYVCAFSGAILPPLSFAI